jgi:hypothetical protein
MNRLRITSELAFEFRDGLFEHPAVRGRGRIRELASRASHRQLERLTPSCLVALGRRQRPPERRTTFRLRLLKFDILALEASRHFILLLVWYQ